MNATINGIIDHMFRDTADNAESRALHEELLNNCLEHYEDLVSRGMSETEAIDAVVDSLKGMKEVIDELPKKPGTAGKAESEKVPFIHVEEQEEKKEAEPPKEKRTEYTFDPATIRALKTDMKANDLKIGLSADGLIHVRCEEMDQMICEAENGVLRVRVADVSAGVSKDDPLLSGKDISVKSVLNFLGKALGSAVSRISVSWNVYIDLPKNCLEEMDLNARSGDIELKNTFPKKISAHNNSGSILLESGDGETALRIEAGSMSGDVEVFGNAEALTISSMSGDVKAKGTFGTVVMKSTSGDAELTGYAETVKMNSVSGDVNAEMRNTDVRAIEAASTSGDVEIELAPGTESVHSSMRTVSGEASCRFEDAGAEAKTKITAASVSGDVKIR